MNPGERVLHRLFQELFVDEQWSARSEGRFVWWPHRLAQTAWVDSPVADDGVVLYPVAVESRMLKHLPFTRQSEEKVALLNAFASTSAYVLHEDGTLRLRCSVCVHEESVGLAVHLLRVAAAIQAADAHIKSGMADSFGAAPDESPHPEHGWRPVPDDMLNVLQVFLRGGEHAPSQFARDYGDVANTLLGAGLLATSDDDGLTVELPCLGSTPAVAGGGGTALLQVNETRNPQLGQGALMVLRLPVEVNDAPAAANDLNRLESSSSMSTRAHLLGGWCEQNGQVVHVSFLPSAMYRPGLLLSLIASTARRSRFLGDLLHDPQG